MNNWLLPAPVVIDRLRMHNLKANLKSGPAKTGLAGPLATAMTNPGQSVFPSSWI